MDKLIAALHQVTADTVYYHGGSEDLPLGRLKKTGKKWRAFDDKDIDEPFWVSPSKEFAAQGGDKIYKVKVHIPSKNIFGDRDLIDDSLGSQWYKMAVNEGRVLYDALENEELFKGADNWESIFASIVGIEYDVVETKEFVDWAKSKGFKAAHVGEAEGDTSNLMVFDPRDVEILEQEV